MEKLWVIIPIGKLSVIADEVILSPGCHLSKTKVYPHINLPKGEYINQTIHNTASISKRYCKKRK